ncbi:MAG: cytochrome-c oxidase, cbb3-type subunit II [Alcaligenaceae bacterium]|nr:cytochrome-c oxidase, cbb3-type subunit II [Alcaligenaceae bacterium]
MANKKTRFFSHETIEKNLVWMILCTIIVVSFAAFVQIVPLFFQHHTMNPEPGVKPLSPLQLVGRDVYIRQGCVGCHSQEIRTLQSEVHRYGPLSVAGEFVYDHPFLWGSKRTGPDLARVGGRYSNAWHEAHLKDPRQVVPESIMPPYAFLADRTVDDWEVQASMNALKTLGVPYTDAEIEKAPAKIKGKTEMDALIAYLQNLGVGYTKALREEQAKKQSQGSK